MAIRYWVGWPNFLKTGIESLDVLEAMAVVPLALEGVVGDLNLKPTGEKKAPSVQGHCHLRSQGHLQTFGFCKNSPARPGPLSIPMRFPLKAGFKGKAKGKPYHWGGISGVPLC